MVKSGTINAGTYLGDFLTLMRADGKAIVGVSAGDVEAVAVVGAGAPALETLGGAPLMTAIGNLEAGVAAATESKPPAAPGDPGTDPVTPLREPALIEPDQATG